MNEIEATRKELGKGCGTFVIKIWTKEIYCGQKFKGVTRYCKDCFYQQKGFNLACEMKDKECKEKMEMARKEMLEKFENWIKNLEVLTKEVGLPDRIISFKDYSMFKQSLEENK